MLKNYIMESYYRITMNISMKTIWGIPGAAELPGTFGDHPGTPLGLPRDAPGGNPMDHKKSHVFTNGQRQKISIAASESFRCNASPQ